jgi:hypothetical protein
VVSAAFARRSAVVRLLFGSPCCWRAGTADDGDLFGDSKAGSTQACGAGPTRPSFPTPRDEGTTRRSLADRHVGDGEVDAAGAAPDFHEDFHF